MARTTAIKRAHPLVSYISEPGSSIFIIYNELSKPPVLNARDLGGLPVSKERAVVYHRFVRSGRLFNLDANGVEVLKQHGVTTVIDLRMDEEVSDKPDTMIDGIEYVRIPLVCTATAGITHGKSMAKIMFKESRRIKREFTDVDAYMDSVYENILFSEETRGAMKAFFRKLFDSKGCVLFHCAGGKDRAGLLAMLIEWLLGVEEDLIVYDYMQSKCHGVKKRRWSKFALTILPVSRRFRAILFGMMTAKECYIENAMRAIMRKYGTPDKYFIEALGFTEEELAAFKEANTEPKQGDVQFRVEEEPKK